MTKANDIHPFIPSTFTGQAMYMVDHPFLPYSRIAVATVKNGEMVSEIWHSETICEAYEEERAALFEEATGQKWVRESDQFSPVHLVHAM